MRPRGLGLISVAIATLTVAMGSQAQGASFTVVNNNAAGPGSLQQAILDANNAGGADTITFAPEVTGSIPMGAATVTGPTAITGPGAATLTINGRFIIAATATTTITALTVNGQTVETGNAFPGAGSGGPGADGVPGAGGTATGGNATSPPEGGGAVMNQGELLLDRVVVTGGRGVVGTAGQSTGTGGRGGNGGGGGLPTSGGTGGNGVGGSGATGDLLGGGIRNEGSMTIRASTVTGNSAIAGDGGDANATGGAGGAGAAGGAAGGRGGNGIATGVKAGSVRGGGIYNAGTMIVEASTVTANTATAGTGGDARATGGAAGGGVPGSGGIGGAATATGGAGGDALGAGVYNAGSLELRNSTISGNVAVANTSPGTATGVNGASIGTVPGGAGTAIAGRAGVSNGGGIANQATGDKSAALNSVTIAANSATSAANVSNTGTTLTIVNSIVSNPLVGASCSGAMTSGGFNIDNGTSCGFTQVSDRPSTDPELGLLQDNGGPTASHAPAATSPAIDGGSGGGLTSDQRGEARPSDFAAIANAPGGDGSDVGAIELEAPELNAPLAVDLVAKRKQEGERLRVTVTCSEDCDVLVAGAGKASGERFKTKKTAKSLAGGAPAVLKVRLKQKAKRFVTDARGKATLTVTASAGTETATDASKVKLKP